MNRRAAPLLGLLACLVPGELRAATPGGDFNSGGGRTTAKVTSWGPDCGPRPGSGALPGGNYTYADGLLVPQGGALPAFAPAACIASGIPGLSALRSGKTITCRSKPGASKQVDGRLTLKVVDVNALRVTQRFSFDWRLKGSHCVVAITNRLDFARVDPVVADTPPPPPPETAEPPPPEADACADPGPLAKLRAKGSSQRVVKMGGRVRLAVSARDAKGCAVADAIGWSADAGKVTRGVLDVRGVAAGTKVAVVARAGTLSVDFVVEVLEAADLAALRADQPELVEGEMTPLPPQAGAGVGGGARDGDEADQGVGRILLGVFIGFGIVAVVIGLVITRRSLQQRNKSLLDEDMLARYDALTNQPTPIATPALSIPPEGPEDSNTSKQCPTCERLFEGSTRFCPFDSAPLGAHAPASEDILLTSAGLELGALVKQERICPHCGARYPSDVMFCGLDGTRLVLLN